tara:strand:+ start:37 stop:1230 length:1194 start_codon:yes stop_codon:yes gene_type:complete
MPSYDDHYVDLWCVPTWKYRWYNGAMFVEGVQIHLYDGDVGGDYNTPSGEYFAIYPHPWKVQQYEIMAQAVDDGVIAAWQLEPVYNHQFLNDLPNDRYVQVKGGGHYPHRANNNGEFPSPGTANYDGYHLWGQNLHYDIPRERHHTIGSEDYTGGQFGSYATSTNVYLDGVSASGTAEEWFTDFQICENALKACIDANGRYPLNPSVTATFGSYNAGTNTYSAGANAALSATGWYTEFSQCSNALVSAMSEIDRLKADLFIAQQAGSETNQPQATAAPEIQIQTVNQPVPPPPERTEDVADDPLGELPDFVELVFEPRAEIPQIIQSDDISDFGLLRRTRFAQPTDDVAAFSEFTYNTTTFSPRETVSPAFQSGDEPGVFEGIEFESERRRRDATGQ